MKIEGHVLEMSIQELYLTFSVYPRFQEIKECTLCISSDKQETIQPIPLRLLSVEQLWTFAWNMSCLTWGDITDFKHFLPRMIELMLFQPEIGYKLEPMCVFRGLAHHRWLSWPTQEQKAVERVFLALWHAFLETWQFDWIEPDRENMMRIEEIDDLICGICHAYTGVPSFIQDWSDDPRLSAMIFLADFVGVFSEARQRGRLSSSYWDAPFYEEMRQLVCQQRVVERLQVAQSSFREDADEHWFLLGGIEIVKKLCTDSS